MAGTCWQQSDWKQFEREARLNTPYYVVRPQFPAGALYDKYVFTKRTLITGHKTTDGGTIAGTLCRNFGPVYDSPPSGMGPLSNPYTLR